MQMKPRFTITCYKSLDDMKAEEYRYWQSQPTHKRIDAVVELSSEAYGLKDLPDHGGFIPHGFVKCIEISKHS